MENKNNKLYVDNTDTIVDRFIGLGCNGMCYHTKDNKVLKLLDDGDEENIEALTTLESDVFVFPRILVYDINTNEFIGYIMDYVEGTSIDKMDNSYDLSLYIDEVKKVEKEIEILTDQHVHIFDANQTNIMISKNGISIIDTDFYEIQHDIPLIKYNLLWCAGGLMYPILKNLNDPVFVNDRLNFYCSLTSKGIMKPSNLINELINELYKNDEYCFKTLGDLSASLRLIRR